jgi:putative membrane protein
VIPNFNDHAANERTFLAWVRTVIALMAFGFLIEKFNLFLQYLAHAIHTSTQPMHMPYIHGVGEGMVALAILAQILATYRFFSNRRNLLHEDSIPFKGGLAEAAVAVLLTGMGLLLLIFLSTTH